MNKKYTITKVVHQTETWEVHAEDHEEAIELVYDEKGTCLEMEDEHEILEVRED